MKNEKKIEKLLGSLPKEERLALLEKYLDDDEKQELAETTEEETKEEEQVEEKKEVKQETVVKEEKKEDKVVGLTKEDLESILTQFASKFVTKEEVEQVKEEVSKVSNKAKPFGVKPKVEKTEAKEEININDYLAKLNNKFTG